MAVKELTKGSVCRLVKLSPRFPPGSTVPRVDDFVPSTREKEDADKRGSTPLLSVFDEERTTLDQAKNIYGSPNDSIGFGLSVKEIRKIRIPGKNSSLRVIRDPLPTEMAELPGASGHCGIEGLHRPAGSRKTDYKYLRVKLVELAEFRG